jgi:putative spermidine/putrescine transport system permease protein
MARGNNLERPLGNAFWLLGAVVLALLPAPLLVVIWVSFSGDNYLIVPPSEYSLRWYAEFFSSAKWLQSLGISVALALVVAIATTAISLFAALAVEKVKPRARAAFEFLVLLPLIFPHAAMAIALRAANTDLKINATFIGLVIAHIILSVPFCYRPIAVNLRKLDPALREAAMSLGGGPAYTLRKVVLPLLRPGIVTSLWFSFIISFDEVNMTVFLVGTQFATLPVNIYAHLADSADPLIAAISTFLIFVTIALVVVLQRTVGLQVFVDMENRVSEKVKPKVKPR